MPLDAIVLDFDGVLAKSMEQHAEAYRQVLAPYGVEVSDRDVFEREGARSESIVAEFLAERGQRTDAETARRVADEKQKVFRALGTPRLYPDAPMFFDAVRRLAPRLGLVTGTRRENLDRIIPDLLPRIDAVLAQDGYQNDKPHPEPYQKAAAALGVAPSACLVVENAVRGVQSAKAAGAGHVVAIMTTMDARSLEGAGADVVVADHHEAVRVITDLF